MALRNASSSSGPGLALVLLSFAATTFGVAAAACGGAADNQLFSGAGGSTSHAGGAGGAGGAEGGGGPGSGGLGPACATNDDCIALGDACNIGVCIDGNCSTVQQPDGALCTDGLFCTEGDYCQGGICFPGTGKACPSDGNPCHVGLCNEAIDQCDVVPGNDGAKCDDGDSCTGDGVCAAGGCTPGQPTDCSFLDDQCNVGVCDQKRGCVKAPANEGGFCDDGKFCSLQDHCENGACVGGSTFFCPAPADPCKVGMCDDVTNSCIEVPGNDGAACNDGSPCTTGETCQGGVCKNGLPANDGLACDDGSRCTQNDECTNGICIGQIGGFEVYFVEDFSDNSAGWTLGNEWQIGPAMQSPNGVFNPDPAMDHSLTQDNGVAGVNIGGLAGTMIHPYYWLESPPFDTSNVPGPVILSFWRWLNSDYEPFMDNAIEVWDGSNWVEVWSSRAQPIEDAEWKFIQHDLTAYKNAAMRIRFGHKVGAGGVFDVSSWNIDDVLVAAGACP